MHMKIYNFSIFDASLDSTATATFVFLWFVRFLKKTKHYPHECLRLYFRFLSLVLTISMITPTPQIFKLLMQINFVKNFPMNPVYFQVLAKFFLIARIIQLTGFFIKYKQHNNEISFKWILQFAKKFIFLNWNFALLSWQICVFFLHSFTFITFFWIASCSITYSNVFLRHLKC